MKKENTNKNTPIRSLRKNNYEKLKLDTKKKLRKVDSYQNYITSNLNNFSYKNQNSEKCQSPSWRNNIFFHQINKKNDI